MQVNHSFFIVWFDSTNVLSTYHGNVFIVPLVYRVSGPQLHELGEVEQDAEDDGRNDVVAYSSPLPSTDNDHMVI